MTKIRAVIQTDSGTLLVDFPQGIYDLYEKLHSVGILALYWPANMT